LGTLSKVDYRLEGYVHGYKLFLRDTGFKPGLIEHRVYSRVYRFAGTLDRTGVWNGKSAILDLKSGDPAKAAALQTAGYRIAHREMTGISVDVRLAVKLTADGHYRVTVYEDHPRDERLFLAACSLWHWKKGTK
jgi:CRISPR/Cas system-associated exonuclease Cas4 (RecB family)